MPTPRGFSDWATRCAKCSSSCARNVGGAFVPRPSGLDRRNRGAEGPSRTGNTPTLKIREMPREERPREKLAAHGASALTDPELIAILLRTGMTGKNAVEVGRDLLKEYGSLRGLSRCTVDELKKVRGVGFTKAVQLAAAFDLGNRLAREMLANQKIDSPEIVNELVGGEMRMLRKEAMRVVLLDTRYHLIRTEDVSTGTANESRTPPREYFRPTAF